MAGARHKTNDWSRTLPKTLRTMFCQRPGRCADLSTLQIVQRALAKVTELAR